MYCREITVRLSLGISTPRIRGIRTISVISFAQREGYFGFWRNGRSPLALFVPGIGADHVDLALTPDDLAVLADPLDTRSYFHRLFSRSNSLIVSIHSREGGPKVIVHAHRASSRPKPNSANIIGKPSFCKSGSR